MSYEIRVFFPHEQFPTQEWSAVLAEFGATRHSDDAWCIDCGESRVWVGLAAANPEKSHLCSPVGTHWIAFLDTSAGRNEWESAWFALHEIPRLLLERLHGCTVHDCQLHLGKGKCDFRDVDSYLNEFGAKRLKSRVDLTAEQLERARRGGDALLVVDVRSREEFASGHVPQTMHTALHKLTADHRAISQMPRHKPVIFVSTYGDRAEEACKLLAASGKRLGKLIGGLTAWRKQGFLWTTE